MTYAALNESVRLLGGGSGSGADLVPRPRCDDLHAPALSLGGGGCVRNAQRLMPWGATWVRWAGFRLVAEVTTLALPTCAVPMAAHVGALVAWASRKPPHVVALADNGRELGPGPIPLRPPV